MAIKNGNYHAGEFDVSNVTLKELQDVQEIVRQEASRIDKKDSSPEMQKRRLHLSWYRGFLQNSIEIKKIDELNNHYFGGKISLKNKLLEAEVVDTDCCVEYEPLYPVMKNT